MIQKVDNLKKGDLVVVTSNNYNQKSIYLKHTKRDNLIVSITYYNIKRKYESRINTRHSITQRIFKILEDNLDVSELNQYKATLIELGINLIPDYLPLKNGDKIRTSKLYEYIEDDSKLSLVREMSMSNDLGLKRNREIADELWHKPDELIKEIFKNVIN